MIADTVTGFFRARAVCLAVLGSLGLSFVARADEFLDKVNAPLRTIQPDQIGRAHV